MTFEVRLARTLMRMARSLAPANRDEWRSAMNREFEALDGGDGSLGWAAGCFSTALGWRLRVEAAFLASLAMAILLSSWLTGLFFFAAVDRIAPGLTSWMMAFTVAQQIAFATISFLLTLLWAKRFAVIGIVIPLATAGDGVASFFVSILLRDGGALPTISSLGDGLVFLGMEMWPSFLGAALGAAVAEFRRPSSAA